MILSKDFKISQKIKTENPTENDLTMSLIDGRRFSPQNLIENLIENQHQSVAPYGAPIMLS